MSTVWPGSEGAGTLSTSLSLAQRQNWFDLKQLVTRISAYNAMWLVSGHSCVRGSVNTANTRLLCVIPKYQPYYCATWCASLFATSDEHDSCQETQAHTHNGGKSTWLCPPLPHLYRSQLWLFNQTLHVCSHDVPVFQSVSAVTLAVSHGSTIDWRLMVKG